jgi:hypothetical protein
LAPFQIKKLNRFNYQGLLYVRIFYIYNIFLFLTGLLNAETIQDWTNMASAGMAFAFVIPLTICLGIFNDYLIAALKIFINYGLLLVAILFFTTTDPGPLGFAHQISPLYLLILMVPYMNKKFFVFIAGLAVIAMVSYISIRSNIINIIFASMILLSYRFRKRGWILSFLKKVRICMLIFPLMFATLGYFSIFNIFTIGDTLPSFTIGDEKGGISRELFVDSRSAIYIDVITELTKKNSIMFGLGGYGKTKTSLSEIAYADFDKTYQGGRSSTESGMLNYFQWGGIFGGLIYFYLFVKASYLAMYKSRNWFCIMIGLWVAFKAFFSFAEDAIIFSPGIIFLFLTIGICFNKELRGMTDSQIKTFFNLNLFEGESKSKKLTILAYLR